MKQKFKLIGFLSIVLILLQPTSIFVNDVFADHKFRKQYNELNIDIKLSSDYEKHKKFYNIIELDVLNSTNGAGDIPEKFGNNYDFTHFKKFYEESKQPYYYLE